MMKKISLLIAALLIGSLSMMARDEQVEVPASKIPHLGQQSLKSYFPDVQVTRVLKTKSKVKNSFEVTMDNGTVIEFDKHGNWTAVTTDGTPVPEQMVDYRIRSVIAERHPGAQVVRMWKDNDKDHKQHYVLDNGEEVVFDYYLKPID